MYSPNSFGADPPTGHPRDGGTPLIAAIIPAGPGGPGTDALIRLDEVTKRYDSDAAPAVDGVTVVAFGDFVELDQGIHARHARHRRNTRGGHRYTAFAGVSGRAIRL